MITHSHQAPFKGLVLAGLGLVLAPPPQIEPSPEDPVFLPDFLAQTPDQVRELRYGKGRAP